MQTVWKLLLVGFNIIIYINSREIPQFLERNFKLMKNLYHMNSCPLSTTVSS